MTPVSAKRWRIFRQTKRGFYSLWLLSFAFALSLGAELICNSAPLLLIYEGNYFFPAIKFYQPSTFAITEETTVDYRQLSAREDFKSGKNWMVFPVIPFHPNETVPNLSAPPPTPPTKQNWLGTDDRGRDLLARLIFGFRNSLLFALISTALTLIFAYIVGATQGYLGGRVDFIGQRAIEIWSALPVLYLIIFLASLFPASLFMLTLIWLAFSWMGLAGYLRAEVLRLRKMEFVQAARAIGAGTPRILFRHILPNALTPIITFTPFLIAAAISSLAALDYLGLGLPPPTSSWGELLKQGKENLQSWWLSFFPFFFLFLTLLGLNFIGEATRNAFAAKQ